MIQVIERETQKLIDIEETAFDKALHVRVQVQDEEPDKGGDSLDTLRKDVLDGFKSLGAELKETLTAGAGERVKPIGTGDSRMEEYDEETQRAFNDRVRSDNSARYSALPANLRAFRSHEQDVMTHRWLRAAYKKDFKTLEMIENSEAYGGARQQGTDVGAGGELLPAPLSNFIATKRDARERVAPNSMVVTSTSQTLDIPLEGTTGAVGPAAENTAITPTDTSYTELNLKKEKQGRLTLISWELMNDQSASFSIVNIIGNEAARKLAVAWDTAAADGGVGTGTDAANSIATQAETNDSGITGALDRAGVVTVLLTIDSAWRDGGGVALMGNSAVTQILSLIDDANGRPIWSFANDPAMPVGDVTNTTGRVEGVPYLEIPFADPNLYVGNLRDAFAVLMDGGLRIDTSADYAFNADQIAVRVLERRSSGVTQAEAFAFGVTA